MGTVIPFPRRRTRTDAPSAPTPDRRTDLITRVARGDESAFAELYDDLASIVFGVVLKVVRDHAMAEEIVQEVFVELWRVAPRFDPERASVSTWAATIAHRRAVDVVRSSQARRAREERDGRRAPAGHDDVVEAVLDHHDRQQVTAALAGLTETQRQAIELAYFGGLTYAEVAATLDLPIGTAKTRIRDGLIRLRDELGVDR